MLFLLKQKAIKAQIQGMLSEYRNMIKIAVDIRRQVLVGGGEMHADCEQILLENGVEKVTREFLGDLL
jgi:uncharacterized protein with PhoU and TrkA domain